MYSSNFKLKSYLFASSVVAIAALKDKEPGAFLIRDSNSFHGAYGLALKVATPPPNANITGNKGIYYTSF